MYRLAIVALLALGSTLPAAPVPEAVPPVVGALPTFLNLSQAKIDDTMIQATQTTYQTVTKSVPVVVEMGGQKITRIERVTEMVPVTTAITYNFNNYSVVTGEGKTLTLETAMPLIKAAPVILVSEGALDPAFHKLLNKDTLILVRKQAPRPPK